MKLVALIGSPHGMKGNTGKVLASVLEGAQGAGADVTTYSLSDMEVAPCRGCDACHKVGQCAIKDDFHIILDTMLKADAVVLASPNYIFSVSAQMKAFIDRCCGVVHMMALEGKYAAAVVTSGGGECQEVEDYMLRFLRIVGCWAVGSVGVEAWKLFDEGMAGEALKTASDLGGELVEAAQSGQPIANAEQDAFRQFMKQLVAMQKDHWPYEYEYWQSKERM